MTDLITPEEIVHIRRNATLMDIPKHMREGTMSPISPSRPLRSGYSVIMSIDIYPGTSEIEHVSVVGKKDTDPAEAEIIAKAILGDDYIVMGIMNNESTNTHFAKFRRKTKRNSWELYNIRRTSRENIRISAIRHSLEEAGQFSYFLLLQSSNI